MKRISCGRYKEGRVGKKIWKKFVGDGTSLDFVDLGVGGGKRMKGFLNAFSREKGYTYILICDL